MYRRILTVASTLVATTVLTTLSSTACAEQLHDELLIIDQRTSPYSAPWCIKTYIDGSRRFPAVARDRSRHQQPFLPPVLPAHTTFDADRTSLRSRLAALRSLRLMTLWRGRENAIVIGLNRSGYVGISLDQAVAYAD